MAISPKSLFFLVEAMAQAAGILGFKTMDKTPADGSIYYFVGADKLRFKRPCVPGDRVMLRASILGQKRGIWRYEVSSDADGKLCASATILCADR
jgi:3-hydroxyacyl-[acyl-carrier-protein] dehydratase